MAQIVSASLLTLLSIALKANRVLIEFTSLLPRGESSETNEGKVETQIKLFFCIRFKHRVVTCAALGS